MVRCGGGAGGRTGIQRTRIKKLIKSLTMFVAWLLEESNVQKGEEDIQKTERRQKSEKTRKEKKMPSEMRNTPRIVDNQCKLYFQSLLLL